MRPTILILAAAIALAAGCDKGPDSRQATPGSAAPPSQPQASTPSTPAPGASTGQTASPAEKKEGRNPVQGQVDPKQRDQHRDFQQGGDAAGPKSPDTTPKAGSGS